MLAAVGVYGVMSYFVTERRREFGIRAALGATRADLLRLVLERSTPLIAAGIALGLTAGVALARIVRTLLFGVTPFDVATPDRRLGPARRAWRSSPATSPARRGVPNPSGSRLARRLEHEP